MKQRNAGVSLASLVKGQKGVIESIIDPQISLKLFEMGCLPGEELVVQQVAPMGDPLAVRIGGFTLGLRRSEASGIIVRTSN